MNSWDAVIFDLDDTLYPEMAFVRGGFQAVSRFLAGQFDVTADDVLEQMLDILHQGHRGRVFDVWLARQPTSKVVSRDQLVAIYREHPPCLTPHPGVRELLQQLVSARRRLGLVSDGPWGVQQRKWLALGLADYFQSVVFTDQLGPEFQKPDPRPFQVVLRQLDAEPERSVYIGDNPSKDFRGCRQLGMGTIRLRLPDGIYRDLEPEGPLDKADQTSLEIGELAALLTAGGP